MMGHRPDGMETRWTKPSGRTSSCLPTLPLTAVRIGGGRKKQIWFQGASNIAQGWHCRNTELHMMQGQWQYHPMALGRQGSGELFVELMIKFPLPWIIFTWFWLYAGKLPAVLQQLKVGYCLLCPTSHNDNDEEILPRTHASSVMLRGLSLLSTTISLCLKNPKYRCLLPLT